MSSTQYRPDVDGLRAVAVALVFFHHATDSYVPAGYVGVDVFFVISGFVVTRSILFGGYGDGHTGILEFWRRRILRLFPALAIFVLTTGCVFAAFFALTTETQFQAGLRTGIASLIGLSNLYLSRSSSDYFLADQSTNLFLHTWSLGVEEQFYLLYAPLLFVLIKFSGFKPYTSALLIASLGIASLVAFVSLAPDQAMLTYYGLHTRFWQLASGGAIAYWLSMRRRPVASLYATIIGVIGSTSIFIAASNSTDSGYVAPILLATAGASFIIIAGSSGAGPVTQLLSQPSIVYVGKLSYSIYLWHWPVLVFARWNFGIHFASIAISIATTLLLAWISFRFIETPFRRTSAPLLTRVVPFLSTTFILVASCLFSLSRTQGTMYLGTPFDRADWLPAINSPYSKRGTLTARDCLLTKGGAVPKTIHQSCRTNPEAPNDAPKILLIGDSHAFSHFALLAELDARYGLNGFALVHDGCAWHTPVGARGTSCATYQNSIPNLIKKTLKDGDYVLLASYFPFDSFAEADFSTRVAAVNAAAVSVGATLIIELPHIRSRTPAIHCTREWFRLNFDGCSTTKDELEQQRSNVVRFITEFASNQLAPPLLWDPLDELCDDKVCSAVRSNLPVLRDRNHLSAIASRNLANGFHAFLEKASHEH